MDEPFSRSSPCIASKLGRAAVWDLTSETLGDVSSLSANVRFEGVR